MRSVKRPAPSSRGLEGEPRWVYFHNLGLTRGGRTWRWAVMAKPEQGQPQTVSLGLVAWHGPWRKYAFFTSSPECVFEEECLRDIAAFCEAKTREHKEEIFPATWGRA